MGERRMPTRRQGQINLYVLDVLKLWCVYNEIYASAGIRSAATSRFSVELETLNARRKTDYRLHINTSWRLHITHTKIAHNKD